MKQDKPHRPLALALLVAFAMMTPPVLAQTDPGSESEKSSTVTMALGAAFERARSLYHAGRFGECAEGYDQLFSHGDDFPPELAEEVEHGRLCYAACLLAVGQPDEAQVQMRAAFTKRPLMAAPDPVMFPSELLNLFFQVKVEFLAEQEALIAERQRQAEAEQLAREEHERRVREYFEEVQRLASQESVVSKNRRWVAAIPFGVGQFQNGQPELGAVFLGVETLLLATTIAAVSVELATHAQANGGRGVQEGKPFTDRLRLAHNVQLWAGASFLAIAGIGILEAQLSFVPEHRLGPRPRPVPQLEEASGSEIDVQPLLAPTDSGGIIGVTGRF